jgi:hypothetical protein
LLDATVIWSNRFRFSRFNWTDPRDYQNGWAHPPAMVSSRGRARAYARMLGCLKDCRQGKHDLLWGSADESPIRTGGVVDGGCSACLPRPRGTGEPRRAPLVPRASAAHLSQLERHDLRTLSGRKASRQIDATRSRAGEQKARFKIGSFACQTVFGEHKCFP